VAAPTITSVAPAAGPGKGGEIVQVVGADFAVSVGVTFGGVSAQLLARFPLDGDDIAEVWTPAGPLAAGAVDVVLVNLDDDGAPVVGETVTLDDGYTYAREESTADSLLVAIVRGIVQGLKRSVLAATGTPLAVDYVEDEDADEDARLVHVAEVPSIAITGPTGTLNRFLRRIEPEEEPVDGAPNDRIRRGATLAYDLAFVVTISTRSTKQILNLIVAVAEWLNANRRLSIVDPADAEATLRWPMDSGAVRTNLQGAGGLRTATVGLTLRGVFLGGGQPIDRGTIVEEIEASQVPSGG